MSNCSPNLEVGLLQDADQLLGCLAPVCEWAEFLEDVLDQLHIVLPHSLQLGFLKPLMSLGFDEYKTDVTYCRVTSPILSGTIARFSDNITSPLKYINSTAFEKTTFITFSSTLSVSS